MLNTKFTNIVTSRQFGDASFKSEHVYQLYGYLRFETGAGYVAADNVEGTLPHPVLNHSVDEAVVIQGHIFRFVMVDLAGSSVKLHLGAFDVVRLKVIAFDTAAVR